MAVGDATPAVALLPEVSALALGMSSPFNASYWLSAA